MFFNVIKTTQKYVPFPHPEHVSLLDLKMCLFPIEYVSVTVKNMRLFLDSNVSLL